MILLDTVTFLWIVGNSPKLSSRAKEIFLDKKTKLFLSVVSNWEILVKYGLGNLDLPSKPAEYLVKQRIVHGIRPLVLEEVDVAQITALKPIHKDPFDRMLICQALARDLTILTPDKLINQYGVKTVW